MSIPEETEEQKRAYAHKIMERYFDVDIQDADSAMDVFIDNDVDYQTAVGIVQDMFPTEEA